jgi:Transposase, Mutator family
MKPARQFGPLPHVRYRPEVERCLHCGAALRYSHPVWAKAIQFLTGPEHVTNLGWRCGKPTCPFGRTVYRSARAEARQVKGSGYGLDVVVRIGHLRFGEHRTREEIWRELHEHTPVQLSERHVQNLLEVYLTLLRASERDPRERLAATVDEHGGIILALDGLQPEQGNEQLWVVREVLSGAVLGAANLQQASAPFLARLLRPVREAGLPVLGVVSDAQESIRLAVADVFPGVAHQLCQYHALREAAEPLWEADRHLLVQAKKELRGLRDVEERTCRPTASAPTDPASRVVLDTVLALRQVVRERGQLPFAFAGLRVMDALAELGTTLDRCLLKKGMPDWPGCASWSAGRSSGVGSRLPTCARRMAGCARSPTAWNPQPPMRPRRREPKYASGWRATWRNWPRRCGRAGCPLGWQGRSPT